MGRAVPDGLFSWKIIDCSWGSAVPMARQGTSISARHAVRIPMRRMYVLWLERGRLPPPVGYRMTWMTFREEGSTITRWSLTIAYAYFGSSGTGVTTTVSGRGCPTTTFSFTTTRVVGAGAC